MTKLRNDDRGPHGARRGVAARSALLAAVTAFALLAPPVQADDSLSEGAREAGRAVGSAVRQIAHGAKEIGLEIGHNAAVFGKAVGHAAADAGRAVGKAASEGGRAFGRAIRGEDQSARF